MSFLKSFILLGMLVSVFGFRHPKCHVLERDGLLCILSLAPPGSTCFNFLAAVPDPDQLVADEPLPHRAGHHLHRQHHRHYKLLLQVRPSKIILRALGPFFQDCILGFYYVVFLLQKRFRIISGPTHKTYFTQSSIYFTHQWSIFMTKKLV